MNTGKKSFGLAVGLFLGSCIFSALIFQSSVRKATSNFVYSSERKILSLANVEINGDTFKVLKVREANSLLVEIYLLTSEAKSEFMDAMILTDSKDAFYKTESGQTNLFLKDIDDDGQPEIIAPSYDKNMTAHLNIFKFEFVTKKLIKLSAH